MLLRLCQLKSQTLFFIVIIIFQSCSWRREVRPNTIELLTTFPNEWFKTNEKHSLVNSDNKPLPHLLIDTTPEFKSDEQLVNVVIATPEGSAHSYSIDTLSGQRYYNHSYCKQNDVWSSYSGSINRPVFSIGHIPRVLDQLGEPQKVIVWSRRESFHQTSTSNFHQVKLLGAYVEQICPEGNCIGKSNWLARLVFIAVDAEDKSLMAINSLEEFSKVIDWNKSKSTLENIEGRNFIGDTTYPAIKVGQLISYADAFNFFKKRSIFLTETELKKIQNSCHNLYDRLWKEVGMVRPEDKRANNKEEVAAKQKLIAQLKKDKMIVGFANRMKAFTRKYFNEFTTCEKFVYHGNFNLEPEKFWFLSYADIYFRLHKEGYYFDCKTKTWHRNILDERGYPVHNLKRDIVSCTDRDFDQAMSYLPNFLNGLKGEKEYFRFIDYDTHSFGSHRKMYSWVKVKSLRFECRKDPNTEIRKQLKVFPEDVAWKERFVKDYVEDDKIIK